MSVDTRLRDATQQMTRAGLPDPARDARLLLAHAMGISPQRVTLSLRDALPPEAEARFAAALAARLRRQPVSQIIGQRQFWGRPFAVTLAVLDPRPETETLVSAALDKPFSRVLDLGVGSGAILLSLLADRPDALGMGVDLSHEALAVAQQNARALGVEGRAHLRCGDWFAPVEGRFDLVVSNPPYIAQDEMADLAPEVRDWEPHLALCPGGDGLDAYRAIAAGARAVMTPGARIILEIGPTQALAVTGFLADAGFEGIATRLDLDGRDRVVMARNPA